MRQTTVAIIYGSGDGGSHELRRRYLDKGAVEFRDIRTREPDGSRPYLATLNALSLAGKRLATVPFVTQFDGTPIGGYQEALEHLATLPDLPFGRAAA
jgi:hypothetical protein